MKKNENSFIRNIIKKFRNNSILRITYRISRLIIPSIIYFIHLLKNPRLIRFYRYWIMSNLDENRSAIRDEMPWVTFQAKEWLEELLIQNKQMVVFEYGSGGSTLFFLRRVKKLVSIEHDPEWYHFVSYILIKNSLSCEYLLLEPEALSDVSTDYTDPYSFASAEYPKLSFYRYVNSINAFPDKSFDLVFIDGRARPSCILNARNKVKLGGFLILDNSERNHYSFAKNLIEWEQTNFFGPGPYGRYFWQTSVWRKPH